MIENQFTAADLEAVADFLYAVNAKPAYASTFCPGRRDDIYEEFSRSAGEGCLVVYREEGEIRGVSNCFIDEGKNRADVNLLIAQEAEGNYRRIAKKLLTALLERTGGDMKLVFYFPVQNENLRMFLTSASAKMEENEYGLLLARGEERNLAKEEDGITDLESADFKEFSALHDAVFPDIYLSGKDIVEDEGGKRSVFVIKTDGRVSAYGVLLRKGEARWTVEVLAVRDCCRQRGLGRRLLSHMIRQAFAVPGVKELDLVVDCCNKNACNLYFDTGFSVEFENCCYILQ